MEYSELEECIAEMEQPDWTPTPEDAQMEENVVAQLLLEKWLECHDNLENRYEIARLTRRFLKKDGI